MLIFLTVLLTSLISDTFPNFLVRYKTLYAYPPLQEDLRYSGTNNFLDSALYPENTEAWMSKSTAIDLRKAQYDFLKYGLKLVVLDAYRPYSVSLELYRKAPNKRFVAHPEKGSIHNRGSALDLMLMDIHGNYLSFPSDFDDFTYKAHTQYKGSNAKARFNRDFLIRILEARNFTVNTAEWWHFEDQNPFQYPLSDWPLP